MCIFFLQLIDTQFKQSPPAAHRFAMAAVLVMEALHLVAQLLGPFEIRQYRGDDMVENLQVWQYGPALSALRAVCRSQFNHPPLQVVQLRVDELRRRLAFRNEDVRRQAWQHFRNLTFVRENLRVGRNGSGRRTWNCLHEVMIRLVGTAGVRYRTRAGAEAMPGSGGASFWMGPDPLPARYGRLGQVARAEELLSEWVPSYFILPPQ